LDNVSYKFQFRNNSNKLESAPQEVRTDINVMQRAMRRFNAEVDAAKGSPAKLRAAQDALAADVDFTAADKRLQTFRTHHCKRA
jgi:hypothetical protein